MAESPITHENKRVYTRKTHPTPTRSSDCVSFLRLFRSLVLPPPCRSVFARAVLAKPDGMLPCLQRWLAMRLYNSGTCSVKA